MQNTNNSNCGRTGERGSFQRRSIWVWRRKLDCVGRANELNIRLIRISIWEVRRPKLEHQRFGVLRESESPIMSAINQQASKN